MVKKALTVWLLVGMLCSLSVGAWATDVYVETLVGGAWDKDYGAYGFDGDTDLTIIGLKHQIDKLRIGMEFLTGTMEPNGIVKKNDISGYDLEAGFRLFDNRELKVDGVIGLNNINFKNSNDDLDGILAGANLSYALSKTAYLEGSLKGSLSAEYDNKDASQFNWDLKLNALLTRNLIGLVGYRYYATVVEENGYDLKIKNFGPMLGLKFRL